MSKHLTENQTADYCQHKLSARELLSVSDHLGTCEACRQQVERALNSDKAFFALRSEVFGEAGENLPSGDVHLSLEHTAQYVDGMLAPEHLQEVKEHLTSCEPCVLAVDDLRAFRSQVGPDLNRQYRPEAAGAMTESWPHRLVRFLSSNLLGSPALAFGAGLTVLLLAMTVWLTWQTKQKKHSKPDLAATAPSTGVTSTPTPSTNPIPPTPARQGTAAAVIAQLDDGGGRVVLDREGTLSGADSLPPDYRQMLRDVLTSQRIERSSLLAGLNRPGSSLMGGDEQGHTFSVTEPVGKVILSDRPAFRWSKLDGATGYVVEVYDEQFKAVTNSPQLTGNSWTPLQALKRGGTYSWQVKAIRGKREFKSPRPPAPQAKFRILDEGKVNELFQARRAYVSSHLTLGLLYARAGLLDEAEQELRTLQVKNPKAAIVQHLLMDVQTLRR